MTGGLLPRLQPCERLQWPPGTGGPWCRSLCRGSTCPSRCTSFPCGRGRSWSLWLSLLRFGSILLRSFGTFSGCSGGGLTLALARPARSWCWTPPGAAPTCVAGQLLYRVVGTRVGGKLVDGGVRALRPPVSPCSASWASMWFCPTSLAAAPSSYWQRVWQFLHPGQDLRP